MQLQRRKGGALTNGVGQDLVDGPEAELGGVVRAVGGDGQDRRARHHRRQSHMVAAQVGALHLHAAYFMVLALLLPLEFLFDTNIFFTIWSGWYLYKALKNVFNTSPKQTLLRIFLIAFSYLLLFVVAMTGLVGFAIYKL